MTTNVCLYVVGGAPPAIAAAHGDYEDWFLRLLGQHDVAVTAVDGREAYVPGLDSYDGFVVTGSPASMTRPEPWMEAAVELVRYCYVQRTPLLGVCFGHQVIGAAFGGSVVPNPRGWHVGSRSVDIAEGAGGDPLFDGITTGFAANMCHQDIIDPDTLAPQNGVNVIGSAARAHTAVVAAGSSVRGVQFHPEFDAAITRSYVHQHGGEVAEQAGDDPAEQPGAIATAATDCPAAEALFHNFIRRFVLAS